MAMNMESSYFSLSNLYFSQSLFIYELTNAKKYDTESFKRAQYMKKYFPSSVLYLISLEL